MHGSSAPSPWVLTRGFLRCSGIVIGRDQRNWNSVVLMVPQAEEWMIERFGRFSRTATPGLNFAIPFIEAIAYKRSLKESTIPIRPQTAITKDNVHVQLDGAVYTKVENAYYASYGIDDPVGAINVLAQSAMRKEVGNLELDQLFLEVRCPCTLRAAATAVPAPSRRAPTAAQTPPPPGTRVFLPHPSSRIRARSARS